MEYTLEEERELKHLVNVLKYAKPKKRNKAQEKLFNFINKRVEAAIETNIGSFEEHLFNEVFEKDFKSSHWEFRT